MVPLTMSVTFIQEVSTHSAFLSYIEVPVEIYNSIGTCIDAIPVTSASLGVDDDYAIVSLVYRMGRASGDAGRLITVLTYVMKICDPHLGNGPPDHVSNLHPEVPGQGLRLGIGSPVVAYVLVLTGNLTVITTIANVVVDNQGLTHYLPPSIQHSKPGPAHG